MLEISITDLVRRRFCLDMYLSRSNHDFRPLHEAQAYAHGSQYGCQLRPIQKAGYCGKYFAVYVVFFFALIKSQKPTRCTAYQMTRFHSDEYVNFLQTVTPDNLESLAMQHGGLEQGIARCKMMQTIDQIA